MKRIGYEIKEEDPFKEIVRVNLSSFPYTTRLWLMWQNMKEEVTTNFTRSKSNFSSSENLEQMDARYGLDAYHSLSIEGYRVTNEQINKVKSEAGKPDRDDTDSKDVLAAHGYWQAFQEVKKSIPDIIGSCDSTKIAECDLPIWHSKMSMRCVRAGIIKLSHIAGYCSLQVYIRNFRHTLLPHDALEEAMTALFRLLKKEPEASVRAVLGHFVFTYSLSYIDQNDLIDRSLMNTIFGRFNWLIIPVKRRDEYRVALEKTSVENNITLFVEFLSTFNFVLQ